MAPRFLVLRDPSSAPALCRALSEQGLLPVRLPLLAFDSDHDRSEVDAALATLGDGWVVVGSPRALPPLLAALERQDFATPPRFAVVGERSWDLLHAAGFSVEGPYRNAQDLLSHFAPASNGEPLLHVGGDRALDALPAGLRSLGYTVRSVSVYRTLLLRPSAADRAEALGGAAGACFTSPSTVEAFCTCAGEAWMDQHQVDFLAVAIGPTSAAAAQVAGFQKIWVADTPTNQGLARSARAAFTETYDG